MQTKHLMTAVICLAALSAFMPAHSSSLGSAAAGYNVLVFGDFTSSNSDSHGNLAAGGNVNVSSYAVASQISGADGARLVAGGNVRASNGGVGSDQNGTIYAASADLTGFTARGGVVSPQNQVDFSAAESEYRDLSAAWRSISANGTVGTVGTTLNLIGTDPSLNVFSITSDYLAAAKTVNITANPGSTVLINISGLEQTFLDGNVNLTGIDSAHLIYNFYEATSLKMHGGKDLKGSVLAPLADVVADGWSGEFNGQLIANSYADGPNYIHIQFHSELFDGNITVDPVPVPAAVWLFGSAFGFLSVIGRYRKRSA